MCVDSLSVRMCEGKNGEMHLYFHCYFCMCFYMRIYLVYEICDTKNLEIYVLFMSIVFGVLFI